MSPTLDPSQYRIPQDLRVLVAEDTEVSRKILVLIFQKLGIEAAWVADGQQAVERARTTKFDLILMDVWMPELNGMQATTTLKAELKGDCPIIVGIGGDGAEADVKACIDAGMDAYVVKPPKVENLLVLIGSLLQQRKGAR